MLVWVAVFKLVKVLSLVALGVLALWHLHTPLDGMVRGAANTLGVDPDSRHLAPLLARVHDLGPGKRVGIGVGALCYAAVFLVEGCGLLAGAVWAEYLTTIITTSLLPIEIYEIVESFSLLRVLVLVANVAIVLYLVWRLRQRLTAHRFHRI